MCNVALDGLEGCCCWHRVVVRKVNPQELTSYQFNVVSRVKSHATIFSAFAPALLIFIFQLFKNVTCFNENKNVSIQYLENHQSTLFKSQFVSFSTFVVVECPNCHTRLSIVY